VDDTEIVGDAFLRAASWGAEPRLTHGLVEAARGDQADADLSTVAGAALGAGVDREDLIRACNAARLVIRTRARDGRSRDDPAEDHVLDLMDRLTGWCHPDARL
jgi:hypothetical protein